MEDPKQQVKALSDFTDLALAFIEAIKNPKSVDALKQKLVDAETISAEKRKEAQEASDTIAESNRIIAIAEQKLAALNVEKSTANAKFEAQKQEIQSGNDGLEAKKLVFKAIVDEQNTSIAALKEAIVIELKAAEEHHAQAHARHSSLDLRESHLNALAAQLDKREKAVADGEKSLQSDLDDFEVRKKKLVAVATGG